MGTFPPKDLLFGFWAFLGGGTAVEQSVCHRDAGSGHSQGNTLGPYLSYSILNSFVTSQWNFQMFWLTIEPKVWCDRRPPNKDILQYRSVTDSLVISVVCPLPPLLLLYDEWSRRNICWIYIYSFSLKAYESVRAMETSSERQNELSEAKTFGGADQSSGVLEKKENTGRAQQRQKTQRNLEDD